MNTDDADGCFFSRRLGVEKAAGTLQHLNFTQLCATQGRWVSKFCAALPAPM